MPGRRGIGPGPNLRQARRRRRRRVMLVGGATAVFVGNRKIKEEDAKQIEQHTGKPIDELEDQEVEQAMNDLGIQEVQGEVQNELE